MPRSRARQSVGSKDYIGADERSERRVTPTAIPGITLAWRYPVWVLGTPIGDESPIPKSSPRMRASSRNGRIVHPARNPRIALDRRVQL